MKTLLLSAIQQKNVTLVISLLEKSSLNSLLRINSEGKTIAHEFAGEGLLEGLNYLANNSNTQMLLTTANKNNCTPFIMAVLNNQKIIVNYLIENHYEDFASEVHAAAFFGKLKEIKNFDKNSLDKRDTFNIDPLGYAVAAGQTDVVAFLIENHCLSSHSSYPGLFTIALDLQHHAIAQLLLKKINYSDFIKKIPRIVTVLARNNAIAIETLDKLAIDRMILPQSTVGCYSLIMIESIRQNSQEIFAYFMKQFFKENLPISKEMELICSLIGEYKRFQFIPILAHEIHSFSEKSFDIGAQFCCYFIKNDDDLSLDIFLKTFRDYGKSSIDNLKGGANFFYHTVTNKKLYLLPILRKYFGYNYFSEYSFFFATKEDFTEFVKEYLPINYNDSETYCLEYRKFIVAAYQIKSMPKNSIENYEIVSQCLLTCCSTPAKYAKSFAGIGMDLLFDIFDVTVKAKFNWPLLKRIFADIKGLAFHRDLPIRPEYLNYFLQLSFCFSDYNAVNDIVDLLLANQKHNKEKLLSLHIMSFLISKICALFLLTLNFIPSDEIKMVLLHECVSVGRNSSDFISGISLLTLLPKIHLMPSMGKKLCKQLSKITPENINVNIEINQLIIVPEVTKSIFQSMRILYDTVYWLKEWIDSIAIDREEAYVFDQKDAENSLSPDLAMLRSYENCYQVKIIFLQALLEMINALNNFEQRTMILILTKTKNPYFHKELESILTKRDFLSPETLLGVDYTKKAIYQSSLIRARDDLAQLSAACLIAEENIARAAHLANSNKANNVPVKITKKEPTEPTLTIKSNIKNPTKPITTICNVPPVMDENESKTPWEKVTSARSKKHLRRVQKNQDTKKMPCSSKEKAPSLKTQPPKKQNKSIPNNLKNFPSVNSDFSNSRNWEVLKKRLNDECHKSPKILKNSILIECGFAINIPSVVSDFFFRFEPNQLFLVGGAIRNSLRHIQINDFDFIALLSVEKIKKKFPNCQKKGEGIKTILVVYYGEYAFDVLPIENTSYREALLRDSLDYDMVLALLQSDYRQRDFTINALYWSPYMGIVDFCGGLSDLLFDRTIIPIQNGSRFFEVQDSVRILRAVRFASQFNLIIKKDLHRVMMRNIFFLYTVHINKLEHEYQSLVAAVGEIQAKQLCHNYCLYALLSTRIPLSIPVWKDFWSSDLKLFSPTNRSKETMHIGKHIENYLPKTDRRALRCVSKNHFTLFKSTQIQQENIGVTPNIRVDKFSPRCKVF